VAYGVPVVCWTDGRVSDMLLFVRRSAVSTSFHVTLIPVSPFGRMATSSSSGALTDDGRRDRRVVAAAKTAATVLGRRASRPLPSARAIIDSERDCRPSGSVTAAAATAAAPAFD